MAKEQRLFPDAIRDSLPPRRTAAMTCASCRYWSELMARAGSGTTNPSGDLEAMCLTVGGPKSGTYTTETKTCAHHRDGNGLAVDHPGLNMERTQ